MKNKGSASLQVRMARKFPVGPQVRAGPSSKMKIQTGVNKRHHNELKNCFYNERVRAMDLHVTYQIWLRVSPSAASHYLLKKGEQQQKTIMY